LEEYGKDYETGLIWTTENFWCFCTHYTKEDNGMNWALDSSHLTSRMHATAASHIRCLKTSAVNENENIDLRIHLTF